MSNRLRYIILFVVIGLLAAVVVWKYTFRESETSVANQQADVEITVTQLVEAFETDENKSNSLYLDKVVVVSGTVETITEDSLGISVYLKDRDAMVGVLCSFDRRNIDMAEVSSGKKVHVKGICTGYLMDVVLNKCSLLQE